MRAFSTRERTESTRLSDSNSAPSSQRHEAGLPIRDRLQDAGWNPEKFAREEIRGMVRQVFLASGSKPVRQVVFSATEPETDLPTICLRVGELLALETHGSVAVAGPFPQISQTFASDANHIGHDGGASALKKISTRLRSNLWLVPSIGFEDAFRDRTIASVHSFLCELRREFEYSIVLGPTAEEWNRAAAMGQLADGVVLVLSAKRTRRITARNVKEALERANARILGTVLSDRDFPIPEAIYRRL